MSGNFRALPCGQREHVTVPTDIMMREMWRGEAISVRCSSGASPYLSSPGAIGVADAAKQIVEQIRHLLPLASPESPAEVFYAGIDHSTKLLD